MKLVIAADHGGVRLKAQIALWLHDRGHEVHDLGSHGTESVDYPDFAHALALRVAGGDAALGVLVCGTGQGMAMAANAVPGVRAAVVSDVFSARMARQHNDANVLCLGERVVGPGVAQLCVEAWLDASFEGGRHQRRVDKIEDVQRGER